MRKTRLSLSSCVVIGVTITAAAQVPTDPSQPASGAASQSSPRPNHLSTAPGERSSSQTGTPSSATQQSPLAVPIPTAPPSPLTPAQPMGPSNAPAVGVPRSVAPDAGTPPAARAAPACGAADQPRTNAPSTEYPGVSTSQFVRPGVAADAFVRAGVSAAQSGALLPGTPGAPCGPPRDVVLYPDTGAPVRRIPLPAD